MVSKGVIISLPDSQENTFKEFKFKERHFKEVGEKEEENNLCFSEVSALCCLFLGPFCVHMHLVPRQSPMSRYTHLIPCTLLIL